MSRAPQNQPNEHGEDGCDRCGCLHGLVWVAPSELWNAVMRGGNRANEDEFGFCCPTCFAQLAQERGIATAFLLSDLSPRHGNTT